MNEYLHQILTPKCYQQLFVNVNLLSMSCVQLVASKAIGIAIILMSSVFMKLPQLVKILHARSSTGVSFFSQVLMLVTCSINVCYSLAKGFPFSTWGESIALGIQTLAICLLILIYSNEYKRAVLFTAVYFIAMVIMLLPSTPMWLYSTLTVAAIPLNMLSRAVQIRLNYLNGGTGQLSHLYILLMNFRSFGRLYTNITETGDTIRITTFGLQCCVNLLLALQTIYYNGIAKKSMNKQKDE